MQQLLADGNPSCKSPNPVGPKKTRPTTDPNPLDHELASQLVALAVDLASSVVEHGLAGKFPQAAEILKIVDSKGKARPSTLRTSAGGRNVPGPQAREQISPAPKAHEASPAQGIAEQVRSGGLFEPQPDCYVCGTGIHLCARHELQVRALMAERQTDDFDASEILRQEFAKRRYRFPKSA